MKRPYLHLMVPTPSDRVRFQNLIDARPADAELLSDLRGPSFSVRTWAASIEAGRQEIFTRRERRGEMTAGQTL
jgi:hypothetical protein